MIQPGFEHHEDAFRPPELSWPIQAPGTCFGSSGPPHGGLTHQRLPVVQLVRYQPQGQPGQGTHRWVSDREIKTLRAEAALRTACQRKAKAFTPDVIVTHPTWGESLFLSLVWPSARMGIYCEFFYQAQGRCGL
jgi:Glycosyl transferase family 4 group